MGADLDFTDALRMTPLSLVAGRGHYETVVRAVMDAKVSVWIATANLKELLVEDTTRASRRVQYRSVLAVFDELAERGVDVRILHASSPSRAFREAFDSHSRLVRGGLQMRMCPRVHLKAVIVDGRYLYLGSANWTGAGLGAKGERNRNFELGFFTSDELLLDRVQAIFDHLYAGGECGKCGRRETCEMPLSEME